MFATPTSFSPPYTSHACTLTQTYWHASLEPSIQVLNIAIAILSTWQHHTLYVSFHHYPISLYLFKPFHYYSIYNISSTTCTLHSTLSYIPYSGKLWRALLNLVNQSSEYIGEFLTWWLWALPHRAIVCEIILAGFKFGDFSQNRQFAKLKTSPKFPAIRYIMMSPNNIY